MKTKIYLIRHGESIGNAKKQYLGHTDLGLSEPGHRQAEATARALADVTIDAVYSSDLIRAVSTARPHAELRGLEVVTSVGLREIYIGDWEGLYVDDIIERYGDMFTVDWLENFGTFRTPGGESVAEAGERFYATVEEICRHEQGKTLLIAAHAAVIRAFWAKVCDIAPEDVARTIDFPKNASYSELEYEDGRFTAIRYSVASHFDMA